MKKLFQLLLCLAIFFGYNLANANTNIVTTDSNIKWNTQGVQNLSNIKNKSSTPLTYQSSVSSTLSWTKQGGVNSLTRANGVSVDISGNSYVVGSTQVGLSYQTQNGIDDYFIAQYDKLGKLIWIKQVGNSGGHSVATGVSVDSNGNIYVAGYTTVAISGQMQTGKIDYFIAKYNFVGILLWAKQTGYLNGVTQATGISVDTFGNSYVVGYTDKGISNQAQSGKIDYFIAKYDYNGNLIKTEQNGASGGTTKAYGVSVDSTGNIYVAGSTDVALYGQKQNGKIDYFIAKYDTTGGIKWYKQVGASNGITEAKGVSASSSGNVYVAGYTNSGISGQVQHGYEDYFIVSYDSSGNLIWTEQVGAFTGVTRANGVSVSSSGNIYIAGCTDRAISGQFSYGGTDLFIAKYNLNGKLISTLEVGAFEGDTEANGVSADNSGNALVAGYTNVGISNQQQNGVWDYFITKFQADALIWTAQNGVYSSGSTFGKGVSADINGNTYVAGYTAVGISGQKQNGKYDYFVAKYDQSGRLRWAKQVGASGGDTEGNGISIDNSGNIYVTGITNVGISGQRINGVYDYFVAKYDQSGNLIWSVQVGTPNGTAKAYGVSTDSKGNIYIAGSTNRAISGQTPVGLVDYFIARYDQFGNLIWTRQVGSYGGTTQAYGVSTDNYDAANIYVTGTTNIGISSQNQNGNNDYFIAKYDQSGNLIWSRQGGAYGGSTQGSGITVDSSGNSYVAGATNVGLFGQVQNGRNDYLIVKYDTNGYVTWSRQVGASGGWTQGNGISADINGNIYIGGYTTVGISGQFQTGSEDYFIARYDQLGNLFWSSQVGTANGYTEANGVNTDSKGNIYIAGSTNSGISGQTQVGNEDYFIAKYTN